MKKTFVTLLAVAGLTASAQGSTAMTWDSAALDAGDGTLTIPAGTIVDVNYGLFSVTAVLDADAVVNAIKSNSWGYFLKVQDSAQVTASHYSFNLAVNGSSSSTSDGFYTGLGNAVNQSISTAISTDLGQAIASGTTYESMAITMTIGNSGTDFYLTLVDSEGTISELTGENRSGWKYSDFDLDQILYTDKVSYLVLDNTVLGASDAFEANQAAIAASVPEPATASLSLLGLAALMMRRRRA